MINNKWFELYQFATKSYGESNIEDMLFIRSKMDKYDDFLVPKSLADHTFTTTDAKNTFESEKKSFVACNKLMISLIDNGFGSVYYKDCKKRKDKSC